MRRRLYLMRHAEVTYFADDGRPLRPQEVSLTERGRTQAEAARAALEAIAFDRVVTSGLPRTLETARAVVPRSEPESWPDFREWEGGRLEDIPDDRVESAFVHAMRVDADDARFLGGESLGELRARVLGALQRLVADEWDAALAVLHGAVNRVILSHALGSSPYLGRFEQAPACINLLDFDAWDDWVVRVVNYAPYEPLQPARTTSMEDFWTAYRPFRERR